MTLLVIIGALLAIGCGVLNSLSILWKKRGVMEAPCLTGQHPVRSFINLFKNPAWLIGVGVAAIAWFCHIGSVALAPLSLAQILPAVGLIFLPLFGKLWFDLKPSKFDWAGIVLCVIGLTLMTASMFLDKNAVASTSYSSGALVIFSLALLVLGAVLVMVHRKGRVSRGIPLAAASGAAYALLAFSLKGVFMASTTMVGAAFLAAVIIIGIIAFYTQARALQIGDVIPVTVASTIVTNTSTILGSFLIYNDSLGHTDILIAAKVLGFVVLLFAALIFVVSSTKIPQQQTA